MQTKITKSAVEALEPGKAIWDDKLKGFGARRQKDGIFYYLRYRVNRIPFMKSLGRHGHLTPDQARKIAQAKLGQAAQGIDPFEDQAKLRSSEVVGTALERYLARRRKVLRPRAYIEVHRHLLGNAKRFHRLRLSEVTKGKIAELLHDVEERSGIVARNRIRSSLSAFFTWTITEGLLEFNPVTGTAKADEGGPRERVLSEAELAEVWNELDVLGQSTSHPYSDIVRLLILTGQRRQEIGALRWDEIDFDKAVITLPPNRTKNNRQHELPLSPQASAVLKSRQAKGLSQSGAIPISRKPQGAMVFGNGKAGFSGWTEWKARLDARIAVQRKEAGAKAMPPWRLHDLRRTVATLMAEKLGVLPHIIEAVLNHVSGAKSGIAGVYNRATYADEMREALCGWATYVDQIASPSGKVVLVRAIRSEIEAPRSSLTERLAQAVSRSQKG
jgi:integrase